jgi:predicted ATPase
MAARREKAKKATDSSSSCRIARIEIEGFKSIAKQTLELGRLNVLIGANGAGKSAVLEAIGLLGAAASGHIDTGELLRRGVRPSAPRLFTTTLRDRQATAIRLEAVSTDQLRYAITLKPKMNGEQVTSLQIDSESVSKGRKVIFTDNGTIARDESSNLSIEFYGGKVGLSSIVTQNVKSARSIYALLRGAVIYDPKTPALRGISMDPFDRDPIGLHGGGLAKALKSLQTAAGGIGPLDRDEVLNLLNWAGGIDIGRPDANIASPSVPMTNEIVRFVDKYMPDEQNLISAFDASEGALYVLFALVLLFHPNTPQLFAVEGLDHALHPRLARTLIRTIGQHVSATKKQIVLTTHNPLVLDGLDLANDDIRLFTVDRDEAGATVLHRIEYTQALRKAQQTGATLSQMWLQGLLGAVPDLW